MRPRTLLILAVVVAALAAFLYFYGRDLPSSDELAQRAKHVLDFKKDQVTRIAIDTDGRTVVLEKQAAAPAATAADGKDAAAGSAAAAATPPGAGAAAADWRIVRPLAARADAGAVEALLDSLASLDHTRILDAVVPGQVGLDRPRAVVALTVAGKPAATVLRVGAAVPTGGEMIVGVSGRPQAYVVGDALLGDLRKKPGDWRDHQLFHGDRDRVERLSWTTAGGPRVALAKRGDGFWLESPLVDRADRDQVEKLLTDLTGLAAEHFLDPPAPPAAQLGLEPPQTALEAVVNGQPAPFVVQLGSSHTVAAPPVEAGAPDSTASLTYARVGGTLVDTRSQLAQTLAKPAADWRSTQLSGLEVHQVDSAVVRADQPGAAPLVLTRSGTDWKRGAVPISYLPVSDLLFAVTEAKADKLLTAAEAQAQGIAQGQPMLAFELKAGQAGSETLTIYPALTGAIQGVPARASGRDVVLLLPAAKLADIQQRLQAVRAEPAMAAAKPAKK